jgi:hypothetical protein
MKIHQLSVFLENKPGQLTAPCKLLADAGISIITLSLADTQQFGILRLVISDWLRAKELLEEAGCAVNITEVVALEVADRPGGLAHIIELIESAGINIEYMYAFTYGVASDAVLIFRFEDPDAAIEVLQNAGVNVLPSSDIYNRVEN